MKTTAKHAEMLESVQAKANKQAPVNSILQAYKNHTVQRQSVDEEELLQGKFSTAQLQTEEEEPLQKKENNTGLPDHLKSGIENLSGYSMDDVKVHYNSSQPATLQAHAYAQGTDIHLAPGQEKHLPHEAWHVVQQKEGRVKPTMQLKGTVPVNDDAGLEKEADVMGGKALQLTNNKRDSINISISNPIIPTIQPKWINDDKTDYYKWDNPLNGLRWFHHKEKDLMYYMIENIEIADVNSIANAGIKKAKPRSVWVDLHSADTMIGEDASVIEAERNELASKDDHEALIKQFEDLTSSGGLLMHAVANGEEVESIGYLLDEDITLEDVRKGEFRTKLLSYIRSDLSMKTFSFRRMGLLVDWKRIWDIVGFNGGRPTIFEEDQQSSRTALDNTESYGEAGGDLDLMGIEFHSMAKRQNTLKSTSNIGNWNEVLTYNAVTRGVVGLLWVVDGSMPKQSVSYEDFFTEDKKQKLYTEWFKKTGMKLMPIYLYTHLGNPNDKMELSKARERLGSKGASSLVLKEKYKPSGLE